jgi:hypothetical protein
MLPWAHGHQLNGITDFVSAMVEKQTARQAQLARCLDNHEAAAKRLSRLLHNERLDPKTLADAVLSQILHPLPSRGPICLAIDSTVEDRQHLLVVSWIMGRGGVPMYWRAYDASVLQGRMKRYEASVIRRAITRVTQRVGKRRVIVTGVFEGRWRHLSQIPFRGNERQGRAPIWSVVEPSAVCLGCCARSFRVRFQLVRERPTSGVHAEESNDTIAKEVGDSWDGRLRTGQPVKGRTHHRAHRAEALKSRLTRGLLHK